MRTTTLLALLVLAGCQAPLTEVMVVVDSDLSAPTTVDFIQVSVDDTTFGTPLERFPASLGIVSQGMKGAFSFQVGLSRSPSFQTIVAARSATGIRFVDGETMMLVLNVPAACACDGTNCPNPGTVPGCDDLVNPPLEPFDPDLVPPGNSGRVRGMVSGGGCTSAGESVGCP